MADTDPTAAAGGAAADKDLTVLERILENGRMIRSPQQEPHARDILSGFIDQVLADATTISGDVLQVVNERIKQLDELITAQLREVMHDDAFQKLESSWR
ncbi:MAG: type VI secretion system contractile sheath large subunit, partial [Rhodospirillaceae bacterium]